MDFLGRIRKSARRCLAALLLLASCIPQLHTETGAEYEVMAAFLYKFASFVAWPGDEPGIPLGICIVGQDPFGGALDRVVQGKSINGREFQIRRLRPDDPVADCHIVFIGASERKRLKEVLHRLQGVPVLTVGDVPGFCESGGTVNFAVADNRIQLEINPTAAERAGLRVSSRLLSLARIVHENRQRTQ